MSANHIMNCVLDTAAQRYGSHGHKLHAAYQRGKLGLCLGGVKDMTAALRMADCYVGVCPLPEQRRTA